MERIWKDKNEEFPFFLANPHSPLRSSMAGRWFFVVCLFFFCCFGCGRSTPCGQKNKNSGRDGGVRMRRLLSADAASGCASPAATDCQVSASRRSVPTDVGGWKKKEKANSLPVDRAVEAPPPLDGDWSESGGEARPPLVAAHGVAPPTLRWRRPGAGTCRCHGDATPVTRNHYCVLTSIKPITNEFKSMASREKRRHTKKTSIRTQNSVI